MDKAKLALYAIIGVMVLGGLTYIFLPSYLINRANHKAAAAVTTAVAASGKKEAVQAAKSNGKAGEEIDRIRTRVATRSNSIVGNSAPDREFFNGVCDSGLYEADPRCSGKRGRKASGGSE